MDSQKICCCRPITGGATGFTLQTVVLLLALAGSGLILDRYRYWKSHDRLSLISTTESEDLSEEQSIWADGWLELGLAWYVAFCSLWLFTVLIASLSFRYYRSVLVVPNAVVLWLGFVAHIFAFAFLVARLASPPVEQRVSHYEETIICILCGYTLFAFIFNIVVIFFAMKFLSYLECRKTDTRPKTIHTNRQSTSWNSDDLY